MNLPRNVQSAWPIWEPELNANAEAASDGKWQDSPRWRLGIDTFIKQRTCSKLALRNEQLEKGNFSENSSTLPEMNVKGHNLKRETEPK